MTAIAAKKARQSNLELLRIVSMLLVMLVHYLPEREPTTVEMVMTRPLKAFLNFELKGICFVCVHCFILISGYFGIRWKWNSFLSLIFQVLFWFFLGAVVALYCISPFIPFDDTINGGGILRLLFNFYQGRWFVSAYLCLYILSPLINSFVANSTEKQVGNYILIFYLFSTVYGWFWQSKEFNTGLSAISLLGLYLIGAWLRKSSSWYVTWNRRYDFLGFMACTLVLAILSMVTMRLGIKSSIYGYLNPLIIIESVFLFQFFRKTNLGHVRWINFMASSAFAAFLLHCNPYIGKYYDMAFAKLHEYDCALLLVLLYIAAVFVIAVLVDKVRMLIWNTVTYLVGRVHLVA